MSKLKAERIHAKRRFLERFGLELNRSEYADLVKQIQSGKAQFVSRSSNRITKWIVKYVGGGKNEQLIAVYDKMRHSIVTFYPIDEDYYGDFKG